MLKIRQLYYVLLVTGWLPLALVVGSFSIWLLSEKSWLNSLVSGAILLGAGFLLINLIFLFIYYGTARKQNNRQALNRILLLIGLFLSNVVIDLVTYNYVIYAENTNTISIENKAVDVVKKMFFSNGDKKYFISPVEPQEKISRALKFDSAGQVHYTFELKGMTYNGILIEDTKSSIGKHIGLTVYRNGRVKVQEELE